jgi:uncharacterized protein (TIGR02246 family)
MKDGAMVVAAVLAALGIGFVVGNGRAAAGAKADTRADVAAIQKLHKADVEATLSQDPSALTKLWSDDGVNLGFGAVPVVGLKDMGEAYTKFRLQYPQFKVLKYAPVVKQVQIADGWAIEIVATDASYQMTPKDPPTAMPDGTSMRLLKRQPDGSWKFALVGMK